MEFEHVGKHSFEDVVQLIAHNETLHRPQQPVAARAKVWPVIGGMILVMVLFLYILDYYS